MDIVVTGKNLEIPAEQRQYMERKLNRVARHLPAVDQAQVQVAQEATRSQAQRIVVQATLHCNGTLLRGEERGANLQQAFDLVVDVLDRQALRYKGRLYKSEAAKRAAHRQSLREEELPAEEEAEAPATRPVVRTKRFTLAPMEMEDAAAQMELLGHTFFLFLNADTGEINLLYTRNDGTYGVIEASLR